jgi:hypothetical protein
LINPFQAKLLFLRGRKDALPKPAKFDPDKVQGKDGFPIENLVKVTFPGAAY